MPRCASLVLVVLAGFVSLAGQQQRTFRAGTDVIVVDVQVVDRRGQPVRGLQADDFDVRIDRQRRRVLSVEAVQFGAGGAREPAAHAGQRAGGPGDEGRDFVLAIDESSFQPLHGMAAREAAKRFIERLEPSDRVGLYTYPVHGPDLVLTTDHQQVLSQLEHVVGVLDLPQAEYRLSLSEVFDLTAGDEDALTRISRRECPQAPGPCRQRVTIQAQGLALAFEGQVGQSVNGLRTLLRALTGYSGRRTLVLVSGGLLASDRVGGRPDVSSVIDDIAREAALANVNLYVLHMDSSFIDAFSPKGAGVRASFMRDATALGAGLDRFAGLAGGALFRVQAGTGDAAFERVLTETSAYYLLGVEPDPADRDGRPHKISVNVRARGAQVRSRTTVVIPN
ncbi:MAG TPA: VWA domain-containing protein [Vicinamibacterales bacterium]|nr:VWA domain-containing protein [Vicinamibacterales bacterium]